MERKDVVGGGGTACAKAEVKNGLAWERRSSLRRTRESKAGRSLTQGTGTAGPEEPRRGGRVS